MMQQTVAVFINLIKRYLILSIVHQGIMQQFENLNSILFILQMASHHKRTETRVLLLPIDFHMALLKQFLDDLLLFFVSLVLHYCKLNVI